MSKGEEIIKDFLVEKGIAFIREPPILITEVRESKTYFRIWYPDFWLSDFHIIIEYFGMNEHHYKQGTKHKKMIYKEMGLDCIPVYQKTLKKKYKTYIMKSIGGILRERNDKFKKLVRE